MTPNEVKKVFEKCSTPASRPGPGRSRWRATGRGTHLQLARLHGRRPLHFTRLQRTAPRASAGTDSRAETIRSLRKMCWDMSVLQREGVVTPLRETHVPLLYHLTGARMSRKSPGFAIFLVSDRFSTGVRAIYSPGPTRRQLPIRPSSRRRI